MSSWVKGASPIVLFSGALILLLSVFVPFPVGCNLTPSCPASPYAWWSTWWANVLGSCLGILLIAFGFGAYKLARFSLGSIGTGLIVDGFILNFPIFVLPLSGIYYATSCPGSGCPVLTPGQWWSIFWPGVVVGAVGVLLIAGGAAFVLYSKRPLKPLQWIAPASATALACGLLVALQLSGI
jgi:hypothetical protein